MARRGKRSSADAIVDLVALLPWWGGVALAIVNYLLLHRAATPDVAAKLTAGNMGGFVAQSLWRSLASVGQCIVPFLGEVNVISGMTSSERLICVCSRRERRAGSRHQVGPQRGHPRVTLQ